jgi:hypothetical protein
MVAMMMKYYHQPYSDIMKMSYPDILFYVKLAIELESKEKKRIEKIINRQKI